MFYYLALTPSGYTMLHALNPTDLTLFADQWEKAEQYYIKRGYYDLHR